MQQVVMILLVVMELTFLAGNQTARNVNQHPQPIQIGQHTRQRYQFPVTRIIRRDGRHQPTGDEVSAR